MVMIRLCRMSKVSFCRAEQLMSIARTILTDPRLLILDEATSNVDNGDRG